MVLGVFLTVGDSALPLVPLSKWVSGSQAETNITMTILQGTYTCSHSQGAGDRHRHTCQKHTQTQWRLTEPSTARCRELAAPTSFPAQAPVESLPPLASQSSPHRVTCTSDSPPGPGSPAPGFTSSCGLQSTSGSGAGFLREQLLVQEILDASTHHPCLEGSYD